MTERKPRKQVVLLRPVPGSSVIHDLWAGTKLLVVALIGVLLTFYPGWVPIGAVALLIAAAAILARILPDPQKDLFQDVLRQHLVPQDTQGQTI